MCRKRWTKSGKRSYRKNWHRSSYTKAKARRAAKAGARKRKRKSSKRRR